MKKNELDLIKITKFKIISVGENCISNYKIE